MTTNTIQHVVPPLTYPMSALEPHIDARSLILHHDLHHAAYVSALNQALAAAPEAMQGKSVEWLLLNLDKVPAKVRSAVRNNAGGHANHSLLWRVMAPAGGAPPTGALAREIERAFGSLEQFQAEFDEAGNKLFGAGWVWLVKTRRGDGELRIMTSSGHDTPLTLGFVPLLLNDVWEHAYYLQHQNRRLEYLQGWWPLVNWVEVERLFERGSWVDEDAGAGVALHKGAVLNLAR